MRFIMKRTLNLEPSGTLAGGRCATYPLTNIISASALPTRVKAHQRNSDQRLSATVMCI